MGRCDTKRSDTLGFVSGLRLGPERFQQKEGGCSEFDVKLLEGDNYRLQSDKLSLSVGDGY